MLESETNPILLKGGTLINIKGKGGILICVYGDVFLSGFKFERIACSYYKRKNIGAILTPERELFTP